MERIIDLIRKDYESYTRGQKTIANYLNDNYDEAAFMTLEQFSNSAGVSTTSVIRFARTLGFDGYSSMQDALRIDLRSKATVPDPVELSMEIPNDEVLKQVFYTDISNIEKTYKQISTEDVSHCVDLITNAGNIYILGLRRSFSLAVYAYSRLAQVRSNVRLIEATGLNYPEEIINVQPTDILLTFLFPRYSRTTLELLKYMRSLGIKTIIVTSENHVALDSLADYLLPCQTRCISGKTSYVAPLSVVNYILALYVSRNPDAAYDMRTKTENILVKSTLLGL